jgi:tetratricopeptide (TPR) repeat protein
MNRKAYSIALLAVVLIFMPVPVFPSKLDLESLSGAPVTFWIFILAKLGVGTLAGWSNDGFGSALGVMIFARIAVQALLWGVLLLVICRSLSRWATSLQSPKWGRVVRISLLCLPVALSAAPLMRVEEDGPRKGRQTQNMWQALWGGFSRHRDGEEYHRAMFDLPSTAKALAMQGNYAEAEPFYREILERERKHERIQYGAESHSTARCLEGLAWILHARGRHDEAESALREAVAILKTRWDGFDRNALSDYQGIQVRLVELLSVEGKHDEAEAILRTILEQDKKLAAESNRNWAVEHRSAPLGPMDSYVVRSLNLLARELWRQGNHSGAEALAREALAMIDALAADRSRGWSNAHMARPPVLFTLAEALRDQENYAEADSTYEQLLATHENVLGWGLLGESLSGYAESLRRQGQFVKALPLAERAIEFREKAMVPGHPALADSLDTLAGIYAGLGRNQEAELCAARAAAVRGKQP